MAAKTGELKPNSAKIFKFGTKPGLLLLTAEGEYRAMSATCTHLNCTVQYRADLQHVWCACHNGHYDLNGKNIAGPPPRPLELYEVHVRGDEIIVNRQRPA
jgi:Rieske Fe-S protein